ncbi:MAG: macro domain-containing protein [Anaerolineaceae bacterium]|nr:macro domain-containing protein [Anaerolineaceae bacterium]
MNIVVKTLNFPAGQKLEIVHGDITQEPVEAIVNAANSHLLHGGGVAGTISRRGGSRIQQESIAWVRDRGAVSFDAPAYTGSGDLPYRYILHTVGPVWGEGDEDNKLALSVCSTLRLADRLKVGSLSLPAISTGIFGFPKDRAARVILKAISEYFQAEPTSRVHLVRLVLLEKEMVDIVMNEISQEGTKATRQ